MHRDQLWQSSATRMGTMREGQPKSVVNDAIRSV
jgi:hypothetical protein